MGISTVMNQLARLHTSALCWMESQLRSCVSEAPYGVCSFTQMLGTCALGKGGSEIYHHGHSECPNSCVVQPHDMWKGLGGRPGCIIIVRQRGRDLSSPSAGEQAASKGNGGQGFGFLHGSPS